MGVEECLIKFKFRKSVNLGLVMSECYADSNSQSKGCRLTRAKEYYGLIVA